jgi:hypothetical protein
MKHLARIQIEFLKEARKWDDLTLEDQKAYLKRHPKSKRKITAKPGNKKKLNEKVDQLNKKVDQTKTVSNVPKWLSSNLMAVSSISMPGKEKDGDILDHSGLSNIRIRLQPVKVQEILKDKSFIPLLLNHFPNSFTNPLNLTEAVYKPQQLKDTKNLYKRFNSAKFRNLDVEESAAKSGTARYKKNTAVATLDDGTQVIKVDTYVRFTDTPHDKEYKSTTDYFATGPTINNVKQLRDIKRSLKDKQQLKKPLQDSKITVTPKTYKSLANFKKTFANIPTSQAKELLKIHNAYDPNTKNKYSGMVDWESGGEISMFTEPEDDKDEASVTFSPGDMDGFIKGLNDLADFFQKAKDTGENVETDEGVEAGFVVRTPADREIEEKDGDVKNDLGFDLGTEKIEDPEYYRQVAKFFEDHKNLYLNGYQD